MATSLKKFSDAYATMTIAVYEPLIVKWISGWSIHHLSSTMAWRAQKGKYINPQQAFATAQALNIGPFRPTLPPNRDQIPPGPISAKGPALDNAGHILPDGAVKPVQLDGFPDAVMVGDKLYPYGILNVQPKATQTQPESPGFFPRLFSSNNARSTPTAGKPYIGARTIPTTLNSRIGIVDPDFDFIESKKQIFQSFKAAVDTVIADPQKSLSDEVRKAMEDVNNIPIFEFFPIVNIEEALSPIGIAHYYRQLYFNLEEGVGPIEQAFTVAPLETLEVVYETVRRQIHEELVEVGDETISEKAVETKNLDEISDKVSSMLQRDASASMSITGSYSTPVYQIGASASTSMSTSTQRSREQASRRVKEVNKRASERITKSFSIKTRDLDDVTTTNLTRRVIRNESEHPVSYGLRRVFRKVRVKVQDLGPRAVWQTYVRDPGNGLARSKFVHFREGEPLAPPEIPPGVPPKPMGGTDTGYTSSDVGTDTNRNTDFVTLRIQTTPDRIISAVTIDSITDLEGGGKDDPAPSPKNEVQWGHHMDDNTHTYTVNIGINIGDARSVSINYTYGWEPTKDVLDEWEVKRANSFEAATQELLTEKFEREKELITERSKIRPRPANELRMEERYEVMNRMISHLFGRGDDPSEPTPLEIEYFHRYFEIERMFIYTHPSWWKPRYAQTETGLGRKAYEITADSDPAPMGSSLGWLIQMDGDTRRNEFINSPWLRICLPIRPGREQEAIGWLRSHIEGDFGFNVQAGPLKNLIEELEAFREKEEALGVDGPNYVTVDSSVGAPAEPLTPEGVFPIIDEFDVTVPTDGFVYDELELSDNE